MYSLSIMFGHAAVAWTFLFKDKVRAEKAFQMTIDAMAPGSTAGILDDFGQHAVVRAEDIRGVLLEDADESANAQIERSLMQARAQAKLQTRAQQDQTLKMHQGLQGGGMGMPTMNGPRM